MNQSSINNIQSGIYITSSQESSQSQTRQKQNCVQIQQQNHTPTAKSFRGLSPPPSRKNGEDSSRMKCLTGDECFRTKKIKLQTQQCQDQQKNILNEFLKYNQQIQKTTDEYINTRKIWNNQYDISKNKKILSIQDEEKQNTITIAQYMVSNSQQSFEEQLNNSLHPSLRISPKGNDCQKENLNPSGQSTAIGSDEKEKVKQDRANLYNAQQNSNKPLKIYQNNKVYKNQYAHQISNKVPSQKQTFAGDGPLKIKYIETDLSTFYISPCLNGKNSKIPLPDNNNSNEQKQRASSVVVKRPNSTQGLGIDQKRNLMKNRLQLNQSQIPSDNTVMAQHRKVSNKLQLDDLSASPMNQITSFSNQNQTKKINSFSEVGTQHYTTNPYNYSTKHSSLKQKDNAEICQTEPNFNQLGLGIKLQNEFSQTQQNTTTEPDSFLVTDFNVYNSKVQLKNNGRRFRAQTRASSQNSQQTFLNQMSPVNNNSIQKQPYQVEQFVKQEDISISKKWDQNIGRKQKQNQTLNEQNQQSNSFQNDLANKEGGDTKLQIGSILKREQNLKRVQNESNNLQQQSINLQQQSNDDHFDQQSNLLMRQSEISHINGCETDLNAYQYIEKLKREKKKRQEDEHKRFLKDKGKMNEQFNEFCIKRQLANAVVTDGNRSSYTHEMDELKTPKDFYKAKNHIKMQEISQKCQKIYEECIQQIQITNQDANNNQRNLQVDSSLLILPQLSPINSTKNGQINPENLMDARNQNQQKNNNSLLNNIYSSVKGNRSISIQPQSSKHFNSKPITISMQKFLNDSAMTLNNQFRVSKSLVEETVNEDPFKNDNINNQLHQPESMHNSPKQIKKLHNQEQSQKKRMVKIKNISQGEPAQKLLEQKKQYPKQTANSVVNTLSSINPTAQDQKIIKSADTQDQSDDNKYATKINLKINEPITLIHQKVALAPLENNNQIANINQKTPPKSIISSPKSILKPSKDWSESPNQRNIVIQQAQDFTLGFDSQTNFSQDQQTQMHPSYPTNYSNLFEIKKHDKESTLKEYNHQISNPKQQPKKCNINNQIGFVRENSGEQEMVRKLADLNENENVYRVQQASIDSSMKFSQEFGYNNDEGNVIQSRFSFQYNQITEASNTDDEISQGNTKNLIKNPNQGSKFTFLNSSHHDIKGSLTAFSSKIIQPMQIFHQSKLIQDNQNLSKSQRVLLIQQLQQISSNQNQNGTDQQQLGIVNTSKFVKEIQNTDQSNVLYQLNLIDDNQVLSDQTYSTLDQTKLLSIENKFLKQENDIKENKKLQNDNIRVNLKRDIKPNNYQKEQINNNINEINQFNQQHNEPKEYNQLSNINQNENKDKQSGDQQQIIQTEEIFIKMQSKLNDGENMNKQENNQLQNIRDSSRIKNEENNNIQNVKQDIGHQIYNEAFSELNQETIQKDRKVNKKILSVEESQFVIDLQEDYNSNGLNSPISKIQNDRDKSGQQYIQLENKNDQYFILQKKIPLIIDPFFS